MSEDYNEAQDIAYKMQVATNVVATINNGVSITNGKHLSEIFQVFTGCNINAIKREEISYQRYYKYREKLNSSDLIKLRNQLNEWYVIQRRAPAAEEIIRFMSEVKKNQMNFFDSIAYHGFTWKQIPGTKKAIFVENTEHVAQRIDYLLKIRRLRNTGKPFVYLDVNQPVTNYMAAVSPKLGVLYDDNEKKKDRKIWLQEIVKKVGEPSVFVYPQLRQKKLSPFSSKKTLMTSLTERGIPFNPKSHRLEFYELLKRFSKNKEDEISAICTSSGHECVARPHLNAMTLNDDPLDFFNPFSGLVTKQKFTGFHSGLDWKDLEKKLILKEQQTYEEDRKMENVIDKIMTYGKYEGKAPNYLTNYSDVLRYDLEFGPANAIVD